MVHTRTPERLFKNPFVNFSWLLNQFHYEGSIKTNTTKCNSFFNNGSISFVAKEISSLYRSRSMTSKNIKQTPRINDLEKKKKVWGGGGIHFYTSLGTEFTVVSFLIYFILKVMPTSVP